MVTHVAVSIYNDCQTSTYHTWGTQTQLFQKVAMQQEIPPWGAIPIAEHTDQLLTHENRTTGLNAAYTKVILEQEARYL